MADRRSLDHILGLVGSVFDAHSSVLFLREGGERYRLASHFSLSNDVMRDAVISPGTGLAGWILRNREPLLINNFDRNRGHLGYYRGGVEAQVKAFMGCPLDGGLGVICLDSKRTHSFSTKDQKILHQFAQLFGLLRADACRTEGEDERMRYYNCLQQMNGLRMRFSRWSEYLASFLELLAGTTGFSHCMLAARDERGESYFLEGCNRPMLSSRDGDTLFPLANGLVGWVFRNHAPIFHEERDAGGSAPSLFGREVDTPPFKSIVCLPLIMHRRTRGALVLADEGLRGVGDEFKGFLQMVGGNLALFLENLYLKNRLTSVKTKV